MPPNAALPDPRIESMDRLLAAGEPARRLIRGETTVTRLAIRRIWRDPARSLAWIAGATICTMILGNILLMQPEQHRAPMFVGNPQFHATPQPTQVPLPQARPAIIEKDAEAARKADLLREIQIELARKGFYAGEPDAAANAKTIRSIRDFQGAANLPVTGEATDALLASILTSNIRTRDQIANLLRNPMDRLERPETVVAIQRALTKLGYGPLRDDGAFGPGTRAALDRFEKDRKLPSRYDNPARVMRELAQASGIAVE